MNCSEFERQLTAYLDKDLNPVVAREMELHLESCASCRLLLSEVRELTSALNDFPWVEPDEKLIASILEKTSGKAGAKNTIWGPIMAWFKPVLTQRHVFATLMVLVFFSVATNVLGPEFTASGQSHLNPALWGERVTTVSGTLYKKWREFDSLKQRVADEIGLLKDDLLGRLDYHLTMAVFKSYEESLEDTNIGESGSGESPGPAEKE